MQDIGNHFDRLFRLQEENSSISADFSLLYASYLIGSKRDAEVIPRYFHLLANIEKANDIFSSQITQNSRRGRRTYLHFLALTSPHDSRGIVSAARKLLIPQMIPEGSCPSTSRIQPEPEDLVCACYLYSLGQMTDNEFISLMANALESSFPTILRLKSGQQRCSCNIDVIFSTNFDPFHHSLWANLANVLGPWHPSEKAHGGIDINTLHEQIGSEKLKSEYGLLTTLPTDPITLDYIRNYTFDMQYFETAPKHQAHFIDLFDEEAAVTPISPCNQSLRPPETSVNHPSPAQVSSIPAIVQSFRSERIWWTKAGHPFSNSFLGDELSWSVMEFVAKKMILAALKRHSNPPIEHCQSKIPQISPMMSRS